MRRVGSKVIGADSFRLESLARLLDSSSRYTFWRSSKAAS